MCTQNTHWLYFLILLAYLRTNVKIFYSRPDRISGADINAICQEAGMQAVRENRYIVLPKDFEKGYKNNIKKDENEHEFYK